MYKIVVEQIDKSKFLISTVNGTKEEKLITRATDSKRKKALLELRKELKKAEPQEA